MEYSEKQSVVNYVKRRLVKVKSELSDQLAQFVELPNIVPDAEYYFYPYIFWDDFPNVDLKEVKRLSYAFILGWESVAIGDKLWDTSSSATPANIICYQLYFDRFLRELTSIFDINSSFFEYYQQFLDDYTNSALTEFIKIHHGLGSFSYDEFKTYVIKRQSIENLMIRGLGILDGSLDKTEDLVKAHDSFYIGGFLRDDVVDWDEDISEHRFTYLIRKTLLDSGICEDDFYRKYPTIDEMRDMLRSTDNLNWALDECEKYFQKALDYSCNHNIPEWESGVNRLAKTINDLRVTSTQLKIK